MLYFAQDVNCADAAQTSVLGNQCNDSFVVCLSPVVSHSYQHRTSCAGTEPRLSQQRAKGRGTTHYILRKWRVCCLASQDWLNLAWTLFGQCASANPPPSHVPRQIAAVPACVREHHSSAACAMPTTAAVSRITSSLGVCSASRSHSIFLFF